MEKNESKLYQNFNHHPLEADFPFLLGRLERRSAVSLSTNGIHSQLPRFDSKIRKSETDSDKTNTFAGICVSKADKCTHLRCKGVLLHD